VCCSAGIGVGWSLLELVDLSGTCLMVVENGFFDSRRGRRLGRSLVHSILKMLLK
jgi:hypothetical protein